MSLSDGLRSVLVFFLCHEVKLGTDYGPTQRTRLDTGERTNDNGSRRNDEEMPRCDSAYQYRGVLFHLNINWPILDYCMSHVNTHGSKASGGSGVIFLSFSHGGKLSAILYFLIIIFTLPHLSFTVSADPLSELVSNYILLIHKSISFIVTIIFCN